MNVVVGLKGSQVCSCGRHGVVADAKGRKVIAYTDHGPQVMSGDYPQCVKDLIAKGGK